MRKDRPTDVLSFPLGERGADGRFYLGDIIISVPVAFRQGREKGHGLERELKLLAIHGFLHLLGYDHSAGMEEEERAAHGLYLAMTMNAVSAAGLGLSFLADVRFFSLFHVCLGSFSKISLSRFLEDREKSYRAGILSRF